MPPAIDEAARGNIVFYAALGYSQRAVAEEVGVSRNTARKYLELARAAVEDSSEPRATLCAILEGEYDWEAGTRPDEGRLDFMSM